MKAAARGLALALVLSLSACNWPKPPLRIVNVAGGVTVDVQTLGEYVTSISRVRVAEEGGKVVWELKARAMQEPQLNTIGLRCGSNPADIPERDLDEYEVVVPASSKTFFLSGNKTYVVQVWDPHSLLPSRRSFSLRGCK